jgi:mannose-6-phosphate isomerase-like protein (cupin superfamily)
MPSGNLRLPLGLPARTACQARANTLSAETGGINGGLEMDIRNRENTKPIINHDVVTVYELAERWSLAEQTRGTYIEFIDDFEISPGAKATAHYHDTHEWYFILEGLGVVQIENETRRVKPGDLIYIPRNARHMIYPTGDDKIRAFCIAASYQPVGGKGWIDAELPEVEPAE